MIKEYLLETYISIFEKIYITNNHNQRKKLWNKIKKKSTLLEYATQKDKRNFKSNIIVYEILNDKSLWNTPIYINIVNHILKDKDLARIKIEETSSFLLLILANKDLELTDMQKQFVVSEAENCPHTEKYYKEKRKDETYIHGIGFRDLRLYILKNISYTIEEKTILFKSFYPDNEFKFDILNNFEWEIAKDLGIANEFDYSGIYYLKEEDIIDKVKDKTKAKEIFKKINLCKSLYNEIPEEDLNKYKNNN